MSMKPSKTKRTANEVKTKAIATERVSDKSRVAAKTVKHVEPEPKQKSIQAQRQEQKQSAEDMIVELLKGDAKYTRKLLKLKMMGSGVHPIIFGRAIDQLELAMKIVYVPSEVISIQDKENAVVRLKQRVIASKRAPN